MSESENYAANMAALEAAEATVRARSRYTDPDENAAVLRAGLLWRLLEVVDPADVAGMLEAAVEFVTPEPL